MDKVIGTSITRCFTKSNDELYELLKVVPAKPISVDEQSKSHYCDFQPRYGKQYMIKRNHRFKVKTVKDIRALFEDDMLRELPDELEKQQNIILRKIKTGSIKDNKTKQFAKKLINCDKPITKSSWQMLMNINPEGYAYSTQYVRWNETALRLNGSKGGKNKFICDIDLGKIKKCHILSKRKTLSRKRNLLQNSLSVNFKPGPLSRKKALDTSYQKYHVGHTGHINLPKLGLEIQPLYEKALDPTLTSYVNTLRDGDGLITNKWAEFSVTVLGKFTESKLIQINDKDPVIFDLKYRNDQTRLLMRRDSNGTLNIEKRNINAITKCNKLIDEYDIKTDIKQILSDIMDAVEININQDNMFVEDDEFRVDSEYQTQRNCREKNKKRYCELNRLDVNVIRLPEYEEKDDLNSCRKSYCTFGCICNSLSTTINLKGHCGLVDCMFKCKCNFSNYSTNEVLSSDGTDYLPDLLNLNKNMNGKLSKEEQKFRQTVIVTGDKNIILKSKKRSCKVSKKYEDFYTSLSFKSKTRSDNLLLSIVVPKLNCENIEPWCMVHNLYKCFCKGKFTETAYKDKKTNEINKNSTETVNEIIIVDDTEVEDNNKTDNYYYKTYKTRLRKQKPFIENSPPVVTEINDCEESNSCCRTRQYKDRKYSNGYYKFANSKIQEMEVNDVNLQKRLNYFIYGNQNSKFIIDCDENIKISENSDTSPKSCDEDDKDIGNININCMIDIDENDQRNIDANSTSSVQVVEKSTVVDDSSRKPLNHRPKLVAWLESSYQKYKQRLDAGITNINLEPPKKGKVALYPWDFILSRYKERKNFFLISNDLPHRIFMAVNKKKTVFHNCTDIDCISSTDWNEYPATVRRILTDTGDMKDYFCILYGTNDYWEFIGTVAKIGDCKNNTTKISYDEPEDITYEEDSEPFIVDDFTLDNCNDNDTNIDTSDLLVNVSPEVCSTKETAPKQSESSKWFVMTVEEDFSEIQFYNRGFFVTHEGILKAIKVSRRISKTVRISSPKCTGKSLGIPFGIYAIPNANENCVFIGPYNLSERLGIETLKTFCQTKKLKRTRGSWIITDKVDNIAVINNPLSFMPSNSIQLKDIDEIESTVYDYEYWPKKEHTQNDEVIDESNQNKKKYRVEYTESFELLDNNDTKHDVKSSSLEKASDASYDNLTCHTRKENTERNSKKHPVTPIKIKKCNSFLNLNTGAVIKAVSLVKPSKSSSVIPDNVLVSNLFKDMKSKVPFTKSLSIQQHDSQPQVVSEMKNDIECPPLIPIACKYDQEEETPQVKIASVYSTSQPEVHKEAKQNRSGRMVILKPEDINKKIANIEKMVNNIEDENMAGDIDRFLGKSPVSLMSSDEVLLISDDEDSTQADYPKKVYIECMNIEKLGVIPGEMDNMNRVRFEFPGFAFSQYYKPEEVFDKINQVFSRKVYIPENLTLKWRIVESVDLRKPLLSKEDFESKLVMTPVGMLKSNQFSNVKTYFNRKRKIKRTSAQSNNIASKKKRPSQESSMTITKRDLIRTINEACYTNK